MRLSLLASFHPASLDPLCRFPFPPSAAQSACLLPPGFPSICRCPSLSRNFPPQVVRSLWFLACRPRAWVVAVLGCVVDAPAVSGSFLSPFRPTCRIYVSLEKPRIKSKYTAATIPPSLRAPSLIRCCPLSSHHLPPSLPARCRSPPAALAPALLLLLQGRGSCIVVSGSFSSPFCLHVEYVLV